MITNKITAVNKFNLIILKRIAMIILNRIEIIILSYMYLIQFHQRTSIKNIQSQHMTIIGNVRYW